MQRIWPADTPLWHEQSDCFDCVYDAAEHLAVLCDAKAGAWHDRRRRTAACVSKADMAMPASMIPRLYVHHNDDQQVALETGEAYDRVRWDAPTDQADVIAELRRARSRLQASIIPQPFAGDLQTADIILCLLNPGLDPGNWLDERDGTTARDLKLAGLRQDHVRSPFWCVDPEIANTGAFRWWWPKFAALADGLVAEGWTFEDAIASPGARVACIEIVAYHSRTSAPITADLIAALPSSRLAIEFVKERAAEGEQVILFRNHAGWGLADNGDRVRLVTDSQRSINVEPDTQAGRVIRRRMNPGSAAPAGQQPFELPDPWFTLTVHDGALLELPGLYEWRIGGVGTYVGRYTRGSRPTREYTKNVRNLLGGRGYRPGNAAGSDASTSRWRTQCGMGRASSCTFLRTRRRETSGCGRWL